MSSFWDAFVDAVVELLRILFSPVEVLITTYGNELVHLVVGTPYPNQVFTAPSNGAWPNIYEYYWSSIIPLSLTLYGLMFGIVIFLESTSHLFGGYHRTKLKKRLFTGLLGILSWWWVAALSLQFIDALTGFLVPDLSEVSIMQSVSFGILGVLGLVVAHMVELTLFVILILIYAVRQLALYLFVLLMPLLIAFWIPGLGPFSLVSRLMTRLAGFFVPLLFMTVPVALLLRLGALLGHSMNLSMGGIGAWLLALLIPFAAVLSPLVLFWQAGAFFLVADRTGNYVSGKQAQQRFGRIRDGADTATHGGQNFGRGVRGEPAVNRDNQQLLDASRSPAHRAGTRVANTRTRLQSVFSSDERAASGGHEASQEAGSASTEKRSTKQNGRNAEFETLRRRGTQSTLPATNRDQNTDDADGEDTPRYIH